MPLYAQNGYGLQTSRSKRCGQAWKRRKNEARLCSGTRRRVPTTWKEEGEDKALIKRMVTFGSETCILGDPCTMKATEMATSKNLSWIQAVKQNRCWNTNNYEVDNITEDTWTGWTTAWANHTGSLQLQAYTPSSVTGRRKRRFQIKKLKAESAIKFLLSKHRI